MVKQKNEKINSNSDSPSVKLRKSISSTVLGTSSTGAITADQRYFVYGQQRDAGPVVTAPRGYPKFTGQKLDAGTLWVGLM